MEYFVFRGSAVYRSLRVNSRHIERFNFLERNTIAGCIHTNNVRLYHRERLQTNSRFQKMKMLSSPALSVSRPLILEPAHSRSIVISKVIAWCREANLTSWDGIMGSLFHSTPVNTIREFYEWTHEVTGLPWVLDFMLCSFCLQCVLNVPIYIYQEKWITAREKFSADMIAIGSSLGGSRSNLASYHSAKDSLMKTYGCQTYKLVACIIYQVAFTIVTATGVRSVIVFSDPDVRTAMLPWGVGLGEIDLIILPVLNIAMNLLLIEVAEWKRVGAVDGWKMTFRRASVPYVPQPSFLLNLKRACVLPMFMIYIIIPSGVSLHFFVMMMTTMNVRLLSSHTITRRALQIPPSYFETDKPYQDFLEHIRSMRKK